MVGSISSLSLVSSSNTTSTSQPRSESLAALESQLTAKKAAFRDAKTEEDKNAIHAEIGALEKRIEDLKTRQGKNGGDNTEVRTAPETAGPVPADERSFDPATPFGNRVLNV